MTTLQVTGAIPISENLIQVSFSEVPYFSNQLDIGDSSDPTHFVVTPLSGGIGLDGQPVRSVSPMLVEVSSNSPHAPFSGSNTQLNVWLDRSMSCYPCQYTIQAANIKAQSGDPLDPVNNNFTFFATRWFFVPPGTRAHGRRDIANPQSLSALIGTQALQANLGTYIIDASGDYSYDEGLESLKKRVYRRIVTRPNGFGHLPGYGIGLQLQLKKLATAAIRAKLVAEIEKQIGSEPDVQKVKAFFTPAVPGLYRLTVLVRTIRDVDAKFVYDATTEITVPPR